MASGAQMRLAGDAAIYGALARHFESAGGLGEQKEPISVARAQAVDSKLDSFFDTLALLKSKGYSQDAASDLADATANGQRSPDRFTLRFASVYGDPSRHAAARG